MAQFDSGIGDVTPNAEFVQMAMSYSRSYMLNAPARLGNTDALGDEVRTVSITWPRLVRRMWMLCTACCMLWPA